MIPIRSCVGCRQRLDQHRLTRFISDLGHWCEETQPRTRGRGAYLCSHACAERVKKNKRYPGLGTVAVQRFAECAGL